MPQRRKIQLADGKQHDGTIVNFEPERESFSTYLLEDGTTLKIKAVLTEAVRLDDLFLPNGDPSYAVQAAQILSVVAPEHLRKKQ